MAWRVADHGPVEFLGSLRVAEVTKRLGLQVGGTRMLGTIHENLHAQLQRGPQVATVQRLFREVEQALDTRFRVRNQRVPCVFVGRTYSSGLVLTM